MGCVTLLYFLTGGFFFAYIPAHRILILSVSSLKFYLLINQYITLVLKQLSESPSSLSCQNFPFVSCRGTNVRLCPLSERPLSRPMTNSVSHHQRRCERGFWKLAIWTLCSSASNRNVTNEDLTQNFALCQVASGLTSPFLPMTPDYHDFKSEY